MLEEEAREYHASGRPGKIAIAITKPCATQHDLALAYTPGVAVPVREIQRDPLEAVRYTARANLVAVVTNGSAVLGLGNVGPLAGKPVMEGKALLFKRFADVDVFDIELDATDPDEVVRIVKALEPTFGGINLEDIPLPRCHPARPASDRVRARCLASGRTVNFDPTAEELADIAIMAAERARSFGLEPRVALLSFSNFGSTSHPRSAKMAAAAQLVKSRCPGLMVDGEMMADVALSPALRDDDYSFSDLAAEANVMVFPSLEAANVAYKLLQHLGGAVAIGPILVGMAKPVHVLSRGADVTDIANIAAIAVIDAQDAAQLAAT